MIRRSFFQTLAVVLLPRPLIAAAKAVQPVCERPRCTLCSPAPIQDPEWLRVWREIPKLAIFAKDLPDPSETPIYLLGLCQTRQAARTFRRDRMESLKTRIPTY